MPLTPKAKFIISRSSVVLSILLCFVIFYFLAKKVFIAILCIVALLFIVSLPKLLKAIFKAASLASKSRKTYDELLKEPLRLYDVAKFDKSKHQESIDALTRLIKFHQYYRHNLVAAHVCLMRGQIYSWLGDDHNAKGDFDSATTRLRWTNPVTPRQNPPVGHF